VAAVYMHTILKALLLIGSHRLKTVAKNAKKKQLSYTKH